MKDWPPNFVVYFVMRWSAIDKGYMPCEMFPKKRQALRCSTNGNQVPAPYVQMYGPIG